MKVIPNSYRIYRRQASGYFYFVDETQGKPKHTSLKTKDPKQAQRILDARLMGRTLPAMAKEVGNAYLREGDPEASSHTWRRVIKELLVCKKRGKSTQERIENAAKDKALIPLLDRPVGETKATEIFEVIRNGGVATNVFLRRFHNFALELSWIHKAILTKYYWPKVVFSPKIAITSEQHEMIMSQETHPERRAYYQLCWFFGGSNSDMAHLRTENIDWERGTVTFIRRKTKALCHQAFGRECAEVLKTLPTSGALFPYLVKLRASDRATVFKQRCSGLGIEGVTIHSYRYAWAERAAIAGMPERFAQAALGHGSKAVHRAYARRAELHVPCLEELTEVRRLTIARARIEAGVQEIRIAA